MGNIFTEKSSAECPLYLEGESKTKEAIHHKPMSNED